FRRVLFRSLDNPAAESLLDVGPLAVRQAFAAAPKPTRRDSPTPRPALAGPQRQHRRIRPDEVRPPSAVLVDQLAQRLEYREGPGDGPQRRLQAALTLPRTDAREMAVERGDEGAPRQPQARGDGWEPGSVTEIEPARHQGRIDGQCLCVLDVHARDARRPRARPHRVLAEVRLGDAARV